MPSHDHITHNANDAYSKVKSILAEKDRYHPAQEIIELLELAAKQGHPEAAYELGLIFELGKIIPNDFQRAVYWYQQAANLGNSFAQNNLGKMYEDGRGTDKNILRARECYQKSADLGNSWAKINLERLDAKNSKNTEYHDTHFEGVIAANRLESASRERREHIFLISTWIIVALAVMAAVVFSIAQSSNTRKKSISSGKIEISEANHKMTKYPNMAEKSFHAISPFELTTLIGKEVILPKQSVICPEILSADAFYIAYEKSFHANDRVGLENVSEFGRAVGCTWARTSDMPVLLIDTKIFFSKTADPTPEWLPSFFASLVGSVFAEVRLPDGKSGWVLPPPLNPLIIKNNENP